MRGRGRYAPEIGAPRCLDTRAVLAEPPRNTRALRDTLRPPCTAALARKARPPVALAPEHPCSRREGPRDRGSPALQRVAARRDLRPPASCVLRATAGPPRTAPPAACLAAPSWPLPPGDQGFPPRPRPWPRVRWRPRFRGSVRA